MFTQKEFDIACKWVTEAMRTVRDSIEGDFTAEGITYSMLIEIQNERDSNNEA